MNTSNDPLAALKVAAKRLRMEGTEGLPAGPLTADQLDEALAAITALVAAAQEYRSECENPAPDLILRRQRRMELFAELANFPESKA